VRGAFIDGLCELAERDERVWLLTGDLGFSVLEGFATRFPGRFVNVGVAEQNMIGVAAGLCLSGKVVFVYSIANFPVLRCLEQIRNDVCYHDLNVRVVSIGGGFGYGAQGYTHHGTEDLAVMRALPGMTVVAPADSVEARLVAAALGSLDGPCYVRLQKGSEAPVHDREPDFALGRAICVRDGDDVTLVSTGGMLATALSTATLLAEVGIATRVLSMHTLRPVDAVALGRAARGTRLLATLEEHSLTGGLYSAVVETLGPEACPVIGFGLPERPLTCGGSSAFLLDLAGLSPATISAAVAERLNR
jgi:transketolase